MGLFINQGKQDDTQDNKFNIITAKDVLAQITGISLAKTQADTLEIKFKVLAGEYKNRIFFDRVNYNPLSDFSWKYRALRKAAGCPYNKDEGAKIDIEALLLNKAVTVDLSGREGTNKNKEKVMYQNVTYKNPPKNAENVQLEPYDDEEFEDPFGNTNNDTPQSSGEQQSFDNTESENTSAEENNEEDWG